MSCNVIDYILVWVRPTLCRKQYTVFPKTPYLYNIDFEMVLKVMDAILRTYFHFRQKEVEKVLTNPAYYQSTLLKSVLQRQQSSAYGKTYTFDQIKDYQTFSTALPIIQYKDIHQDIQKMMDGADNVLVSDKVRWFAKSSGTSVNKSKYIPVTRHYLTHGHLKCTWTAASVIYNEDPSARLFADKNLIMAGSLSKYNPQVTVGDISAIMLHHFPRIGRRFATPSFEIALLKDWEEKIKLVAEISSKERVTLMGGVPTWTIVLFKEILRTTGAKNISEVWPHLKTYIHGGIGLGPYEQELRKYLPSKDVVFREVYNATEGYFAIQNEKTVDGMSLMCNHQIFYEFIPTNGYTPGEASAPTLTLEEVEADEDYVIVITNSSGLYRYVMGDIVRFCSVRPYKIKVVGRVEQYINAFGEELMVCNTDEAVARVCQRFDAIMRDYHVAPRFMTNKVNGCHEWVIEFEKIPDSIPDFSQALDRELRSLNSDYEAKRYKDIAMSSLMIHVLPVGSIDRWMKNQNKYGGQHKLPRLANDRLVLTQLLTFKDNQQDHHLSLNQQH